MSDDLKHKAYVGGIPYSMDDDGLKKVFSYFKPIRASIQCHKGTTESRGFGFVIFSTQTDLENAIRMWHKRPLEGRRISVTVAVPMEQVQPGTPAAVIRADQNGFRRPSPLNKDRRKDHSSRFLRDPHSPNSRDHHPGRHRYDDDDGGSDRRWSVKRERSPSYDRDFEPVNRYRPHGRSDGWGFESSSPRRFDYPEGDRRRLNDNHSCISSDNNFRRALPLKCIDQESDKYRYAVRLDADDFAARPREIHSRDTYYDDHNRYRHRSRPRSPHQTMLHTKSRVTPNLRSCSPTRGW